MQRWPEGKWWFLSENNVEDREGIKEFSVRGYRYDEALSSSNKMAFVRKE